MAKDLPLWLNRCKQILSIPYTADHHADGDISAGVADHTWNCDVELAQPDCSRGQKASRLCGRLTEEDLRGVSKLPQSLNNQPCWRWGIRGTAPHPENCQHVAWLR